MSASKILGFTGGASPSPAPSGEPAAPAQNGTPQGTPAQSGTAPAGYTVDQLRTLAADMVSNGHLTQEQADAALQESGAAYSDEERAALSQDPSKPAAVLDAAGLKPAQPHEFQFPTYGGRGIDDPEIREFDANARAWLSEAGFTREIGSAVAQAVERVANQWGEMNEPQRALWRREQEVKLQNLYGDQCGEKIASAQALVQAIEDKRPGLVHLLEATGAGSDVQVIGWFVQQAEILRIREGRTQ